jgi:hypothetical protein
MMEKSSRILGLEHDYLIVFAVSWSAACECGNGGMPLGDGGAGATTSSLGIVRRGWLGGSLGFYDWRTAAQERTESWDRTG